MPRLRHLLLSLLAVVLAFGAGVAWGMGPLTGRLHSSVQAETRELDREQRQLRAEIAELEGKVEVGEDFARQMSRPLGADQLAGHTVAMFLLPGAQAAQADQVEKAVESAAADVITKVTITGSYVDPANAASPLEDLALRLVPPGVTFPSGASAIDRVSTVLARSTVTVRAEEAGKVDDDGAEVLAGLQELGAVKVAGEPGTRATLAVLVAGPRATSRSAARATEEVNASNEALRGLARTLDVGSRGAVVVGPPASTGVSGLLRHLRSGRSAGGGFSTVDLGDQAIGPIAVVLALAEQLRGDSGDYGSGPGADRLVPAFVPAKS